MDNGHNNGTRATPKPVWSVPKLIAGFAKLSISHPRTSLISHDKTNPENNNAVATVNPDVTVQDLLEQFAKLSIRDQKSVSRLLQSVDSDTKTLGAASQPRLITFEPFCRLPLEIRDLIFDYALATPRVIYIKRILSEEPDSFPETFRATCYEVPLLRTCYQSRNRALAHYKRLSAPFLRPVLVNPKLDIIFFDLRKKTGVHPSLYTDLWPFILRVQAAKRNAKKHNASARSIAKRRRTCTTRTIAIRVPSKFLPPSTNVRFAGLVMPSAIIIISMVMAAAVAVLGIIEEIILVVTERTAESTKQLESMPFYKDWDKFLGSRVASRHKYSKVTILTQPEFDARMS